MYLPEGTNQNCGVYRIKNMRNGKVYIGSTNNAKKRQKEHFRQLKKNIHHSDILQNAWNVEEDKSIFEFQMFIYCREDDLIAIEQSCLDIIMPAYNVAEDASAPMRGKTHSDEVRQKMRNAKLGKPSNRKGVGASPEAKERIKQAKIKYYAENPEAGKIHSKKLKKFYEKNESKCKNIPRTEHTKQILRVKCSGWKHKPEAILKISASGKGRTPWHAGLKLPPRSNEVKNKIGKSNSIASLRSLAEGKHASQVMTKEQLKAKANKAWETRRWNKLKKLIEEMVYFGA